MKALLKWTLILVIGLFVVLAVGGLFLPRTFTIVRSVNVNAPPDKVYTLLEDPRRWKEWTVWNQRDPAMRIRYSGPPSGQGAVWEWQSQTEGDGRMTFTTAERGRKLGYDLYFPDWGSTSRGDLTLSVEGGTTRVTWTMVGDMGGNPLFRWMGLMADGMVGKDFETGLAQLKALAEKS